MNNPLIQQSQDRMNSFSFPRSANSQNDQPISSSLSSSPSSYYHSTPHHVVYKRRNSAHTLSASQIIEEEDSSDSQLSNEPRLEQHYSRPRLSLYLREAKKVPSFETSSKNLKQAPENIQIVRFPSHGRKSSFSKSSPSSRRPSASLSPRRTSMASIESRYSLFSPTLSPSSPPSTGFKSPTLGTSPGNSGLAHRRSGSLSGTMITNDLFGNDNNNSILDNSNSRFLSKPSCPIPPIPTSQLDLPFAFDKNFIGHRCRKDSSATITLEDEEKMALFSFDTKTTVLNTIDTHSSDDDSDNDDYEELKSINSSDLSSRSARLTADDDTPSGTKYFDSDYSRRSSIIYKISSPTNVVVNLDDIFNGAPK